MNITTGRAILEDTATEASDQGEKDENRQYLVEGRRLVNELDQAQILKAATYLGPSRHAGP